MAQEAVASSGQLKRGLGLERIGELLFTKTVMGIISAIVAAIFWEWLGRSGLALGFPTFTSVIVAWADLITNGTLAKEVPKTLQSFAVGYAISIGVGVILGALIGRFALFDRLFSPYINGLMSTPKVAFIPIFIIWFGATSIWPRVAMVFLYSFYVIVINTATGVKNADFNLIEMARSFGAKERQLFTKVLLPSAIPMIIAGLRLGTARAIKGMITGEMLITIVGMGGLLTMYGASFMTDYLFAMIFTVFVLAFLANVVVEKLEYRLVGWRAESVGTRAKRAKASAEA